MTTKPNHPAKRRFFNDRERHALAIVSGNACEACGVPLDRSFHADHVQPHSRGGRTVLSNAQALCPACNLTKGSKMQPATKTPGALSAVPSTLHAWQAEAIEQVLAAHASGARDFLVSATFGAGKTRMALATARRLADAGAIDFVIVVSPAEHVRDQWAAEAHRFGLRLGTVITSSDFRRVAVDGIPEKLSGYAITSSMLVGVPEIVAAISARRRVLFIADEAHHNAAGRPFGEAVLHSADGAVLRLGLSGTPYRADARAIPFLHYAEGVGVPHYEYTHAQAAMAGLVAPVSFRYVGGELKIDDRNVSAYPFVLRFGKVEDEEAANKLLSYALMPPHEYTIDLVREADAMLERLREAHPTAGGIVFCARVSQAKAVARYLREHLRRRVRLVVEDSSSTEEVAAFNASAEHWLVSVRKVYEGTNIARLRVGVYAANVTTEGYFSQAWGRLVRLDQAGPQAAVMFIPADKRLIALATGIGEVRRHKLDEHDEDDDRGPHRDDWKDGDHDDDDDDVKQYPVTVQVRTEGAGGSAGERTFSEAELEAAIAALGDLIYARRMTPAALVEAHRLHMAANARDAGTASRGI